MSYENAKANLKEFALELKLELSFDENHTCILGIDNTFSLHITYEPNSDKLYLYAPILDGLPQDPKIRLKLYENFLEGSLLGGKMAGGGVGVAVKEELILMHCVLDMGLGADVKALSRFSALFVEVVEQWRAIATKICAGQEPPPFTIPGMPGQPQIGGPSATGPGILSKPPEGFIKI
ncbi:MAG: CesT family type III secretion system chaperone [Chlamydiota bacterium]